MAAAKALTPDILDAPELRAEATSQAASIVAAIPGGQGRHPQLAA